MIDVKEKDARLVRTIRRLRAQRDEARAERDALAKALRLAVARGAGWSLDEATLAALGLAWAKR